VGTFSKALGVYRREGWSGVSHHGAVYLLRGMGQLLDGWIQRLEDPQDVASLSAPERDLLARNAAFRDRHRGRRCFVIGNGPSLAAQDVSRLGAELTFVMSGFWKHPAVEDWQPSYYFLADPLFFDGSAPLARFFDGLRSRISSTTFVVPLYARRSVEQTAILPPAAPVHYVAFRGRLHHGLRSEPDLTKRIPAVTSVSQLAIMAALYMGCSPIVLLGLDHDWLAQRGLDRHFYSGRTVDDHPEAHGDLERYPYAELLDSSLRLWRGYDALRTLAARKGVRIVNATEGGFLDVFERARYEDLLA
jgi:hypothetical protein